MPMIVAEREAGPPRATRRLEFLRALALVASLAASAAPPLAASDGVIEINQVRALAGGVTPGDDPGFPVTISTPGSYQLTGNLDVRNETNPQNVTAIHFVAGSEGSSFDLNGFSLLGPNAACTSPSCAFVNGTGIGIRIAAHFISAKNGTVRGFGSTGVNSQGGGGTLSELIAVANASFGFGTQGHRLRSCEATFNKLVGFYLVNSVVESSRAVANGDGFYLEHSTAERNLAINNSLQGVLLVTSTFRDGVAYGNPFGPVSCTDSFLAANQFDGALDGSCTQIEPNYCGSGLCP